MEATPERWRVPKWVCHARPERSFRWRGHPLPLCARCTAIYPALAVGGVAGFLLDPPPLRAAALALLLAAPMVVDGATQSLGWRESRNSLRFVTGLLYGFACGFSIAPLLTLLRGGP